VGLAGTVFWDTKFYVMLFSVEPVDQKAEPWLWCICHQSGLYRNIITSRALCIKEFKVKVHFRIMVKKITQKLVKKSLTIHQPSSLFLLLTFLAEMLEFPYNCKI
jgi:hypothetical protein